MDVAVVWDPAYPEHDTGDNPEGADRSRTIVEHLEATDLWPRLAVVKPRAGDVDDLLHVHTREPRRDGARRGRERRPLARRRHLRLARAASRSPCSPPAAASTL